MSWRFLVSCCTALLLIGGGGCARNDGRRPIYPVHGKLVVRGQPARGALIAFHPTVPGQGQRASGVVADDGTFQLTTYEKRDGAAEGEYAVTIVWIDPWRTLGDGTDEGVDRLNAKYRNPARPYRNVVVQRGKNDFPPFELN